MRNRPRDHDCPKTFWAIAGDARVEIQAAEGAEPKRPTFTMNAYNGGALNVATYPYPVVVDLDGLKASSRITVLMGHDYAQVVGQGKATITAGAVTITGAMTGDLDAEPALSILTHAKNGFVWPVSIGASVDRLEFVKEGKTAIVNAQSFTGPLYIARKGRLREVSFVGVGADEDAQARIAAQAANGGLSSREEQDMEFREMYKKITGKRSVLEAAGKSADDLLARAEAEDWTGERLDAELARIDELVNLRGSRPTAPRHHGRRERPSRRPGSSGGRPADAHRLRVRRREAAQRPRLSGRRRCAGYSRYGHRSVWSAAPRQEHPWRTRSADRGRLLDV